MSELLAKTTRAHYKNGFESAAEFVGENEKLLLDRADPALRESVTQAGNTLHKIALQHQAFLGAPKFDELAGRWRPQVTGRQIRLSALLDGASHEKGANKGTRRAIDFWGGRGLFTVTEVETSGRAFEMLVLDLEKFGSLDALTNQWTAYWTPIERKLKMAHIQKMREFYSAGTWVAKVDFSVAEKRDLSSSSGDLQRFSKGQIVPAQSLMSLQGFSEQPDYERVEPLGDRSMITVQHTCARCHNVATSFYPVSREMLITQDGVITLS